MEVLGRNEAVPFSISQLSELTGINKGEIQGFLDHLLKLTNEYGDRLGYRVERNHEACVYLVSSPGSLIRRNRAIIDLPNGQKTKVITEQIRKRVASIVGFPVMEEVPQDIESVIRSSGLVKEETYEWDYIMALAEAARQKIAVNTESLKIHFDIPQSDNRLKSALVYSTRMRPCEFGFVIDPVGDFCHGFFPIEPDSRASYLFQKTLELESPTQFDLTEKFDYLELMKRLQDTPMQFLPEREAKLVYFVAKAQSEGELLTLEQARALLRMTNYEWKTMRDKLKRERFFLTYYVRMRGKGRSAALECVLIKNDSSPLPPA